ncbi:PD-(D/E)XK nuclease family protein, partial [Candidatus Aenigmatarchaeota archaeon]
YNIINMGFNILYPILILMIDFDKMVENHLKRKPYQKPEGRYYPSQIGTCMRKVWYSYKFPRETQVDLQKIFHIGNIMHDLVVEILESDKNPHIELLQAEFPFREEIDDFMISGRIDNLILVKEDNKKVLIEVKSSSNIKYIETPPDYNIMQLQLYMHFTRIDDGILLYIDKRNMKTKTFDFKYSVDDALKVIERFRLLHKHIKDSTIPKPESRADEKNKWTCEHCEYRDKCYQETPEKSSTP